MQLRVFIMKIFIFTLIEGALFPVSLLSAIWMKFLKFAGIDKSTD